MFRVNKSVVVIISLRRALQNGTKYTFFTILKAWKFWPCTLLSRFKMLMVKTLSDLISTLQKSRTLTPLSAGYTTENCRQIVIWTPEYNGIMLCNLWIASRARYFNIVDYIPHNIIAKSFKSIWPVLSALEISRGQYSYYNVILIQWLRSTMFWSW